MKIKRHGKCANPGCGKPCTVIKEFAVTGNLFDQTPEIKIEGQLSKEIKEWRKLPMYCGPHRGGK